MSAATLLRHARRFASAAIPWRRADRHTENHRPTLVWTASRFIIAASKKHAFLDRAWIGWLLRATPASFRGALARRLLSLSPHYWVYQWTNKYPAGMSRRDILEAEFQRNAASRQELFDKLLQRYLAPTFVVLDFGCGPGFLAKAVSPKVHRVIASDVSRGVNACARVLNSADNLDYVVNSYSGLENVADASIDLVYSFAVIQHLLKNQTALFFAEFHRVLKPGARGVCHVILKEEYESRAPDDSQGNWVRQRINLRMVYYTPGELIALARDAGLRDIAVIPVASLASMDDDIGNEHLLVFTC